MGAQSAPPSFETELHSHNEAGALSLPLSFPLYYNVPCEMRTKREKLDSKFLYYFKESCRFHLYPFRWREEMKLLASYVVRQLYCLSAKQHNLIHVPISSKNSSDDYTRKPAPILLLLLYTQEISSFSGSWMPETFSVHSKNYLCVLKFFRRHSVIFTSNYVC